jgi:hypothetical protein
VAPGDIAGRATRRRISYRLRCRTIFLAWAPRVDESSSEERGRGADALDEDVVLAAEAAEVDGLEVELVAVALDGPRDVGDGVARESSSAALWPQKAIGTPAGS